MNNYFAKEFKYLYSSEEDLLNLPDESKNYKLLEHSNNLDNLKSMKSRVPCFCGDDFPKNLLALLEGKLKLRCGDERFHENCGNNGNRSINSNYHTWVDFLRRNIKMFWNKYKERIIGDFKEIKSKKKRIKITFTTIVYAPYSRCHFNCCTEFSISFFFYILYERENEHCSTF
jgi:hypothetical protein